MGGFVGTALLEAHGAPYLYQHDDIWDQLFAENFARIGHVTVSDAFISLAQCHGLVPGRPLLLFARGVGGFSAALLFR